MKTEKLVPDLVDSPLDRLLQLVEEGDPDTILAEENLESTFNELMKYGLITLEDEKVFLTIQGKAARKEGVENFIERLKLEQVPEEIKSQPKKATAIRPRFSLENRKLWSLSLFLLMLMIMFFSLSNLLGE